MICPIMSRPVSVSYNDHEPHTHIPEKVFIDCQKEKCALWIEKTNDSNGDTIIPGHCGLIQR